MSDDLIPYLGEDDLDRIARLLEAWESGRLNTSVPVPSRPADAPPIETRLAQATTDIPALSYGPVSVSTSTTGNQPIPGVGQAELYIMDFVVHDLIDTGLSQTVYNLFDQKVFSGDWLILARDPGSGQYFVIFPGFGSTSSSSSASASMMSGSVSASASSGNGVIVVTDVECGASNSGGGGLHVTDGILTGSVQINGVNYPVSFTINTGGSS